MDGWIGLTKKLPTYFDLKVQEHCSRTCQHKLFSMHLTLFNLISMIEEGQFTAIQNHRMLELLLQQFLPHVIFSALKLLDTKRSQKL